ncbi:MAG TPA: hypothetical protein VJY39_03135 [Acidisphaera sp.]|nr:hypothetical protein [Acidisphaera sp.]
MEEPTFESERGLEHAVAAAIEGASSNGDRVIVLHGFGLDLAVFAETSMGSRACFFEVKAFAQHHGRCGVGNGRGEGNQIRLLYNETTKLPRDWSELAVFERTVRWVLGNRSEPLGAPRFLFFDCKQAQEAAMGGVRPGKQNNLNLARFRNTEWITWPVLIGRVTKFVYGG